MALRTIARLLDWRRALVYTHRWLGIAGCVLFVAWFFSGIVMMYARMPSLAGEERLARASALDLSAARLTPAEAANLAGVEGASSVEIGMRGDRPIYHFTGGGRRGNRSGGGGSIVFADTGEVFAGIGLDEAETEARRFEPDHAGPLRHDAYLTEPDQWTLQARASLPMHRFALDDAAGTHIYVSETTGEVMLRTTRRDRVWGYLGPVTHWLYFTPLRRHQPVWSEVIIWSSLIGCVMCLTGLVWGLLRFSPFGRFRLKRQPAHSPYAGMMQWHHYAGLLFGAIALTFTFSGLLSMGPFDWFRPTGGSPRATAPAPEGGLETISIEALRAAHAALSASFVPKRLEPIWFQGELYWAADRAPALAEADDWRSPHLLPRQPRPRFERRYVAAGRTEESTFTSFPHDAMPQIAAATMPGVPVRDAVWLTAFDAYYYDARGTRNLPVLRVRYADPQQTWLYLDPAQGRVVLRNEEVTRLRRWLYQGLHSLDFPFLYYRRPLWDIVVIILSIGGLVLSATTLVPAWRRLNRHGVRWRVALTGRRDPAPAPVRVAHQNRQLTPESDVR